MEDADEYAKITFGIEVEHDQPVGLHARKMIQLYGIFAMAAIVKSVTGTGAGQLTALADGQYPDETERTGWWLAGVDNSAEIVNLVFGMIRDSIEHAEGAGPRPE